MAETKTTSEITHIPTVFHALPNMFHVADLQRTVFVLQVPEETTLDHIRNPGALAACLQRQDIRRFSRIEIHGGEEWWAELLVVRVDAPRKRIYTKVLNQVVQVKVDELTVAQADPLTVVRLTKGNYRVLRGTKDLGEFQTRAEAQAFADQV